jgi:hypothetical protein
MPEAPGCAEACSGSAACCAWLHAAAVQGAALQYGSCCGEVHAARPGTQLELHPATRV